MHPGAPSFAGEASGASAAFWGFNGTLPPQSGTTLGKEFNPENPPLGSTVLATFVWVGSSNIIDSVADFLWTGRRVGNTYTLVEYVTSGGISMATYAATNVQNYPVPKTRLGDELVVFAYLRSPTSAGGALVSAYTNVQSIGPHRSAAGSGATTPTNAHPGPITVDAGILVYGVSMSSDGLVGREAPAGFTYITGLASESPSMQLDAEYDVRTGAGSVDPVWGWSFQSTHTWLASAIALDPAGTAPANQPPLAAFSWSCSGRTCTFTNGSTDPDGSIAGYSWTFGDGASSAAQNPSHTYAAAGTYTVTLTATDNDGAEDTTSRSVGVTDPNQPPVATFTFSCSALACGFTSTSGDPDGTISAYTWAFGDGATSTVQSPSHTYATGGTRSVTLTVTDNQGATASVSQNVTVTAANQPPVASFTFNCSALTCSFMSTSSDPDGTIGAYSWAFGDGATSTAQSPSHTYATGGTRTVTLTVTDNQGGATSTSRSVTVTAPNQPPTASFWFSCSGLTCGFNSTSSDPDGAIASHNWSLGDGASAGAPNPSHTYGASGTYTVTLTVTDNQGATSAMSQNVTVNAPPPPPSGGIAYDTDNGTANQQNINVLIKGFNPRNPHLGDAIVATFIWSGPAVITSVSDHLTDANLTPVGNTYHFVDQVSAGGLNMATYVATNIQNFPDPNPDNNVVLAVRATLSQSFANGAIKLTAWSGVEPTFAAAIGQARSASGASARDTVVGPGPVATNPGALAVAVTVATAPAGRDPPPGFTRFFGSVMTDAFLATETNYQVPVTGSSVDPRWFWAFSQAGGATVTWLATVLSLNPAP